MSNLSKYQQSSASSKTTRKNSAINCTKYRNPTLSPGEVIQAKKRIVSEVSAKLAETSPPRNQGKIPALHEAYLPAKTQNHIETSQMVCNANQLTGFQNRRAPTVRHFPTK